MSKTIKEIGKIEKIDNLERTEIEWKIDLFSAIRDRENFLYTSPYFSCQDEVGQLSIHLDVHAKFMTLSIIPLQELKHSVKYTLGVKNLDHDVDALCNHTIEKMTKYSSPYIFFKYSPIDFFDYPPSRPFTVTCRLKRATPKCSELEKLRTNKLTKLEKLSDDFKELLANEESCDTTLKVKDREFKVHKAILFGRSPVFDAMFTYDSAEKQTGVITIPDCDPDCFQKFLEYLYCGQLEGISPSNAFYLYEISDKYDVQELREYCVAYLMENMTIENYVDVAVMADEYGERELMNAAQGFFNKNARKIFLTPQWQEFLKNNDELANKFLIEMSKVKFEE